MRDESRAIELMGKEPTNPIGECFESSAAQFIYGGPAMNPDGTIMCHGIGIANMPGEEGHEIGHAWLEFEQNGKRGAIDTTWGVITEAGHYRSLLKISYVVTYTFDEFFTLWKKHDYPGPWDLKIKTITEKKK